MVPLDLPTFDDTGSLVYPPRRVVYYSLLSTPGTASSFLAGNRDADFEPTAFSSLLLFCIFLPLLFSFVLLLYTSLRLLVVGLWFSSRGLVLRLLPASGSDLLPLHPLLRCLTFLTRPVLFLSFACLIREDRLLPQYLFIMAFLLQWNCRGVYCNYEEFCHPLFMKIQRFLCELHAPRTFLFLLDPSLMGFSGKEKADVLTK